MCSDITQSPKDLIGAYLPLKASLLVIQYFTGRTVSTGSYMSADWEENKFFDGNLVARDLTKERNVPEYFVML